MPHPIETWPTDFLEALRTVLATLWPDTVPNGIFVAKHEAMIPEAQNTPPFASILLSSMVPADDAGNANIALAGTLDLIYVSPWDGEADTTEQPVLKALYYFTNNPLIGPLQWWDRPAGHKWGDDYILNEPYFLGNSGLRAGALSGQVRVSISNE